jgi:hypothetical protein
MYAPPARKDRKSGLHSQLERNNPKRISAPQEVKLQTNMI